MLPGESVVIGENMSVLVDINYIHDRTEKAKGIYLESVWVVCLQMVSATCWTPGESVVEHGYRRGISERRGR